MYSPQHKPQSEIHNRRFNLVSELFLGCAVRKHAENILTSDLKMIGHQVEK